MQVPTANGYGSRTATTSGRPDEARSSLVLSIPGQTVRITDTVSAKESQRTAEGQIDLARREFLHALCVRIRLDAKGIDQNKLSQCDPT